MATYWTDSSVGFALQTNFATENTADSDFVFIKAEQPSVTFDTEVTEVDLMEGQVGAASERIIGRRSGSITLSMPLEGFVDGYNPALENPGGTPVAANVIPPGLVLMANAMGSYSTGVVNNAGFWQGGELMSCSEYTADGVASATAGVITVDDATASNKIKGGEYVCTAASATTTTVQSGFVKTKAGQVLTLFENATNTVTGATDDVYGTATSWQGADQPLPLTIRWVGNNAKFCYRLVGAICESFTINLNAAETPTIEYTYRFYDFIADNVDGGIEIPDAYDRVPQIIGTANGRVTIGGTATCGLEEVTIEWAAGDLREIVCHSEDSGIESVTIVRPTIKASFSIPQEKDDPIYDAAGVTIGVTEGANEWQSALELGTRKSFGVECGARIGRMFSILIPSGLVVASPIANDELVRYSIELEAASYSTDSTDTAETSANSPIDSIFRIAQG
tara:strand:- start:8406 stop:9758 length:1353 start_codon:yes stop_codon:yes gene_type:complete